MAIDTELIHLLRSESASLVSAGMNLIVFLPTFYVKLSTDKHSLRVLSAGIYHNIVLCLLGLALSIHGARLGRLVMLPFFQTVSGGIAVTDVTAVS